MGGLLNTGSAESRPSALAVLAGMVILVVIGVSLIALLVFRIKTVPLANCSSSRAGDVDGDGAPDRVVSTRAPEHETERSVVEVTTSTGSHDALEMERWEAGAGGFVDIEPDGTNELLIHEGQTFITYESIALFDDGRLSKPPISLRTGVQSWGYEDEPLFQYLLVAWTCKDVTGDGQRELIQAEGLWQRELSEPSLKGTVTVEAYRLIRPRLDRICTATHPVSEADSRMTLESLRGFADRMRCSPD